MIHNLKSFRNKIYKSIQYRADACFDLVDSLCSNKSADTPVKLSLNSNYRRTYNSITDTIKAYHLNKAIQDEALFSELIEQAVRENESRNFFCFVTDTTPAPRPYAKTLSDRTIVYAPNAVRSNKPITIGHKYSETAFLPAKGAGDPPWVLPLLVDRVHSDMDEALLGAQQLQKILNKLKTDKLCVNVVDSGYCKPKYIHALHDENAGNNNLVSIIRARSNRIVWQKPTLKRSQYVGNRGHEIWYGKLFCFKDPATWHSPDNKFEENIYTKSGKECSILIQAWKDMLVRQKQGVPMNEHAFTLCRIEMRDCSGKQVFHKPMWLMVFGERRDELSLKQLYNTYMQRYDIEHFFKFKKNNLLADKFQTPSTQHEENWWSICLLAYAHLFVARKLVDNTPYPWEKYLPEMKNKNEIVSAAQVQRSFEKITQAIGSCALSPKQRGIQLGRKPGAAQPKRKRYDVIIKSKKPPD